MAIDWAINVMSWLKRRRGRMTAIRVEAGNPADSARCPPMIERHAAIYGPAPEQVGV